MPVELIDRVLRESREQLASGQVDESDVKSKARIVKAVITDLTFKNDIHLD